MSSPGVGHAHLVAERQGIEPSLDAQHEVVAVGVPGQPAILDYIVEDAGDVDRLDRGRETDACPAPPAVEVGGDDERGVRQRVVVRPPRRRAGAQLELSATSPCRQPVRETRRAAGARSRRVDRATD